MGVYKNKENNTWYIKHKNKTKRGFKSKKEAQLYEAQLRIALEAEESNESYIFFHKLVEDYLNYYETLVAFGTFRKTETIVRNIILPNIKNKPIHEYTDLDCRNFREYVGKLEYSTRYKNCILFTFKAIFKHAEKYFNLKKNPTKLIDSFKRTFIEKMETKNKEMDIWTVEDFNKFISYVGRENYKVFFITLFFTGARLGEILALQWKDFRDGKLIITKSLTRKTVEGRYEIKDTKNTSSIRDVILGENLYNYLLSYKEHEMERHDFSEEWFIFGRNKPLPQTTINRVKDEAIDKAKLRRIRLHDFRHSHASNLIAEGVNIVAVSRRLGHSDVNMTLKVYTHLIEKKNLEMENFLNKSSQNILNKVV